MRMDNYYDITCDKCARARGKDFNKGFADNKEELLRNAEKEGWRVVEGKNYCPICTSVHDGNVWKSVKDVEPPVDKRLTGVDSSTSAKYMVLTKEGHVVEGYIYINKYSCSGYAVYVGGDEYLNNVTHWIPGDEI